MIKFTFSYKLKLLISDDLTIDTYTGAIGTKLRRNEFALRKEATKFMKDGCCSSLQAVLIIQTPLQPAVVKQTLAQTTPFQKDIQLIECYKFTTNV
jgi:hypothetical protein